MYTRPCPDCGKDISYKYVENRDAAEKVKKLCMSCAVINANKQPKKYKRNCPVCLKEIFYKNEAGVLYGEQNKVACMSCTNRRIAAIPGVNEKRAAAVSGEKNPMYGKSVQDKWVENYGEEVAKEKEQQWLNSLSKASSGERNGMYGKPSPQGSGNGWSGHYKSKQFRSLNELYYLKYLFDNDIKFDNAEKKKYRVSYEFNGTKKSYGMDFYLLESDKYIEIKPKKLINSPLNTAKFEAARKIYGDKFIVLTEENLNQISTNEMYDLYVKGDLKFDKRYEEKFLDLYKKVNIID